MRENNEDSKEIQSPRFVEVVLQAREFEQERKRNPLVVLTRQRSTLNELTDIVKNRKVLKESSDGISTINLSRGKIKPVQRIPDLFDGIVLERNEEHVRMEESAPLVEEDAVQEWLQQNQKRKDYVSKVVVYPSAPVPLHELYACPSERPTTTSKTFKFQRLQSAHLGVGYIAPWEQVAKGKEMRASWVNRMVLRYSIVPLSQDEDSRLLHTLFQQQGFQRLDPPDLELKHPHRYNCLWSSVPLPKQHFRHLKPEQRCNQFPGHEQIFSLQAWSDFANRMSAMYVDEYNYIPFMMIWPPKKRKTKPIEGFRAAKAKTESIIEDSLKGCRPQDRFWFCHLEGVHQGLGEFVNTETLKTMTSKGFAMRMLRKPLMVDGRVIELRIFATVTRMDPLRVYIYREGLVYLCSTGESLDAKDSQVDSMGLGSDDYLGRRHTSWQRLGMYLQSIGIDRQMVWSMLCDLVLKTTAGLLHGHIRHDIKTTLKYPRNAFAVYEFVIALDEFGKPWIMRMRPNPKLDCLSDVEVRVQSGVVSDALSMLLIELPDDSTEADRNTSKLHTTKQTRKTKRITKKNKPKLPGSLGYARKVIRKAKPDTSKEVLSKAARLVKQLQERAYPSEYLEAGGNRTDLGFSKFESMLVAEQESEADVRGWFVRLYPRAKDWERFQPYFAGANELNIVMCKHMEQRFSVDKESKMLIRVPDEARCLDGERGQAMKTRKQRMKRSMIPQLIKSNQRINEDVNTSDKNSGYDPFQRPIAALYNATTQVWSCLPMKKPFEIRKVEDEIRNLKLKRQMQLQHILW